MNIGELGRFRAGIATDTISEHTSASGVTVDGVLLKDGAVTASGGYNISTTGFANELSSSENTLLKALDRLDDYDSLLDWATGKTYRVGNVVRVTLEGFVGTWRCLVAHTAAAAFTTDVNSGNWEISANSEGSRELVTQASHGFALGEPVYSTGSAYAKAKADVLATSKPIGFVGGVTTNKFVLCKTGKITKTGWALTVGATYYVSAATAGAITTTKPALGEGFSVAVGVAVSATEIQIHIDADEYYDNADPTEIAGIPPSLDLDASVGLPPAVTFTRATTASYFDYDGIMKYAASGACRTDYDPATGSLKGWLIEEARTNLLTDTEQFWDSSWTLGQANLASRNAISVDGTMFASKLVQDATASSAHFISQSTTLTATSYTLSFFLKAGENTWAKIVLSTTADGSGAGVYFNLGTGVKGVEDSGRTGTITAIGGGWYRCTVTATATAATWYSQLLIAEADNDHTINGDGKSGIYFSKAQLEAGAFPTSYIPSVQTFTSRDDGGVAKASYYTSTGLLALATAGAARTTYNPSPDKLHLAPKLLLEPAATNLCLQSEDFATTWTASGTTVTVNNTSAPDGNTTADKLANSGAAAGEAYQDITTTAAAIYTFSCFVKAGDVSAVTLQNMQVAGTVDKAKVSFNLSTKEMTETTTTNLIGKGIQKLQNGWFRVWIASKAEDTSTRFKVINDSVVTAKYIYAWGAQVEASHGPTSYIPTTTTAVTRNADVYTSATATRNADQLSMTGTNFTGWYRFDEGTIFTEYDASNLSSAVAAYAINDNTQNNALTHTLTSSSAALGVYKNGTFQGGAGISGTYSSNTTYKFSTKYAENNQVSAINGILSSDDTSLGVPAVSQLNIGRGRNNTGVFLNGHIRRLIFWPARLSNTKLQQMTL